MNLPYILWVAAFNSSFLLGYLLVDLYFSPPSTALDARPDPRSSPSSPVHRPRSDVRDEGSGAPALLEALNKNGLAIFLLVGGIACIEEMGR